MKFKFLTVLALFVGVSASAQNLPKILPDNWAEMQRQAAIEHAYFANGGWRERERANNDSAAGAALLGVIVGVIANRAAEQHREDMEREREYAEEQYRRRIESSPVATVQRRYIRECFIRRGRNEFGQLYEERVCN